jgi:hypothetical protein
MIVSVFLHSGIPFGGIFWPHSSVTTLPVTIEIESMPLPPAEELVEAPDEENIDAPDEDVPDPSAEKQPKEPETPTPPDPPPPDEPDEPEEPDPPAAPPAPLPPDLNGDLKQRIAEREKARAEWQAERDKRRLEREARHVARRKAREAAARKGGAPEAGSTQGTPDPVYLCNPTDKGVEVAVRTERPITSWMPIVPTVFAHFETRPGLDGYLSRANQVYVPKRRIGLLDFAAPAEVLQMKLEEPRGVTIAAGRLDVRCMVGLTYRPKLFPITLKRMPVRIIDKSNNTVSALVNITIFKDASIELAPFDGSTDLPFTKGRLMNSKLIARNIEDHYQAVRLASAFAELFGLKSTPKKPPPRDPSLAKRPPPEAPVATGIPGVSLPPARVRTNPSKKDHP